MNQVLLAVIFSCFTVLSYGYVSESTPFDNPATLTQPIPSIVSTPFCTIRPQTVVEIQRMRESAGRIAQMIESEVQIMNKRKTYIEQMTAYLNDRIRELNKVKSDLAEESRWIELSTNKIEELAQREKLIKMQDILACLNADQSKLTGEQSAKFETIKQLQDASKAINDKINFLKNSVNRPAVGGSSSSTGS